MELVAAHATLAVPAPSGTSINSWQVATKRGTQSGVGVSVSGSGAWAKLTGKMDFSIRHIEVSKTYDEMRSSSDYNMGGGISGFWSWFGFAANRSEHQEQIHQVFQEVSNSQKVNGHAKFDLECSGQYPNVQVDASAYVLVLQITNDSGNTFTMLSSGDPASDTGAQDGNGNALPQRSNNSTITI